MLRLVLLCLLFFSFAPVHGQDPFGDDPFGTNSGQAGQDPFGGGGMDPFGGSGNIEGLDGFSAPANAGGEQPGADSQSDALSSTESGAPPEADDDPIVRLLRERSLETPSDFADGLTWLVRIRRWDEVRRLIDQITSKNWSLEQTAELSRQTGPGLWIRLRNDDAQLSEQQQQVVGEILRAPSKLARQPSWINQWIDRLATDSAGERRLAQLKLQEAGPKAIEQLVSRLLDGDSKVAPIMLAGTVTLFGDTGISALRTACVVESGERTAHVFHALARLPSNQFTAELAAGLQSQQLATSDRTRLSELLLEKYGRLPDRDAIESYLRKEFERRLARYFEARTVADTTPAPLWKTSSDGKQVLAVEGTEQSQHLESWAQLAILKSRMASRDPAECVRNAVAVMQREYQFQPQELDHRWATRLIPEDLPAASFWQQVFEQASEWQMHGAAVNAIRGLENSSSAATAPLNFASDLLHDPRPIIRFTALQLLHDWNPTTDYAGSEQALKTAFEMSKLSSGPHTLVVGLQADLRQAAKQQMQSLTGGDASVVNSASSALKALNGPDPIELILIVDRVADQSLFELFQRIRNSAKGRAIPIAVLTDELYSHERQWITQSGGVIQSVLSRNLEQMQRVYDRLLDELDTEPLAPAERAKFARIGRQFIAGIASDRDRYPFYPIHDYQVQLVGTAAESTAEQRIDILSGLASPQSQLELVGLAANVDLPAEQRIAAANAFHSSVKQFGNQLGREGVVQSYEWYNTHGPDDTVSVRSLGHVLDVIEAFAGKREWPAPL